MAIPSRLMGSGVGAQAAQNICGDTATGLTATGTVAGDAYQLAAVVNQFSTVASGTGAKLMPTEPGAMVIVRNSGASTLTLYPATSSTINGSASIAVPAATTVLVFATAGTTWFAMTAGAAIGVFTTLTTTGTTLLGDAAGDLIGFHGSAGAAQAAFVATLSINALSVSGVVGFTSSTSLSAVLTAINNIEALLVAKGLMAAS